MKIRTQVPLNAYAAVMGVSLSRLHRACWTLAEATPLAMIQARRLVEA